MNDTVQVPAYRLKSGDTIRLLVIGGTEDVVLHSVVKKGANIKLRGYSPVIGDFADVVDLHEKIRVVQ